MVRFKDFLINEEVTRQELNSLEKILDKLFMKLGIDIEFSRHFFERLNDNRNGKAITIREIALMFKEFYIKYKDKIVDKDDDFQAIINDISTDINIPFVINIDRSGEVELVSKTVMRKKNFTSSSPKMKVKT